MTGAVCILLFAYFLSSISQVMLKKSAILRHETRLKEYLNPLVLGGYAIFVCVTLMAIYAYRTVPLSVGAVLETTSYFYITLFGCYLGERITKRKIAALFLICMGIFLFFYLDTFFNT